MKHYYIINPTSEKGFVEVPESEFISIMGTEEIRPYANRVYRGIIDITEVPEEFREATQTTVNNKIARFGEYNKQEISADELKSMIEEVI